MKASGELGKAAQVLSRSHLYHYSCFPSQDVILAFPTLGPRTPTPEQNMLSPHADSPDLQTNSPLPPQLFELPKAKTVPTTTEKLLLFLQYNKARDQEAAARRQCCAPYLPMGGKHWNQEHTPLGQVSATSNSHAPYHFARVETAVLGRGVINRREALGMGSHPRTLAS